ncbi:hypothetical protein H6758_03210 [Candidatus Nomurabacteria bacterium]|nr:hypothetical protein [Candidatus Nomurabacteria bacterium]
MVLGEYRSQGGQEAADQLGRILRRTQSFTEVTGDDLTVDQQQRVFAIWRNRESLHGRDLSQKLGKLTSQEADVLVSMLNALCAFFCLLENRGILKE